MKIYRDGYRYIIGPDEQGCYSMTDGYADCDSLKAAKERMAQLSTLTSDELAKLERVYWTDERFETACDNGRFGPEWS